MRNCEALAGGAAGVEALEGTQGLAAVPVGGGGAWLGFETTRPAHMSNAVPPVWRAPEGPEGTGEPPDAGPGRASRRRAERSSRRGR